MLLDRGPRGDAAHPCFFLTKALHAQAAGADALLVVNDGPGDLSTAVPPRDEGSARWGGGAARAMGAAGIARAVVRGGGGPAWGCRGGRAAARGARKREPAPGSQPAVVATAHSPPRPGPAPRRAACWPA